MMKKNFISLFALCAFCAATLVACGSDDDDFGVEADEYGKTAKDLESMECTAKKDGMIVYLSEDNKRMVCHDGDWIDYFVWKARYEKTEYTGKIKDTVATYAKLPSCNSSYSKDVYYVKSLNINLVCESGEWLELAIQMLPDSVRSINALPACLPSVTGAIVYLSSVSERVICSEGEWVEYKFWLQSSSSGKSSSSYSSSYSSSSSSSSMSILESIFGKCTSARNNEIAYDTNGVVDYYNASDYGYYYCNGSYGRWDEPTDKMIDTVGWKSATDGDFRQGQFSYDSWGDYYENLNSVCQIHDSKYLYYVYDKGWREAKNMEVCFLYACTEAREGKMYNFKGYPFKCASGVWTADSIDMKTKKDWTNASVTYGTLTDTRDGKTYKTVTIGGKTWMAQNLAYKDSTMSTTDYACNEARDPSCATGGLLYRWTAALKLSATYGTGSVSTDSLKTPRQGICPTGWHVPDTTEWRSLITAAGNSASMLKSVGAWVVNVSSSYFATAPTNALGFSAIPAGSKNSSSFTTTNAYFITTAQYSSSYAYAVALTNDSDNIVVDDYYKTNYFSVRCVQNATGN